MTPRIFTASMASGATLLTTAVDIGEICRIVRLHIPTMTSNTDIYIQGSHDGTTYRRIYAQIWSTSALLHSPLKIASGISQAMVELQGAQGYRYLKIEFSTAITATAPTFRVICADNY
jgi:hypothetical protein